MRCLLRGYGLWTTQHHRSCVVTVRGRSARRRGERSTDKLDSPNGRLASHTQQLHSISVNHSPNPTPTHNPNLNLTPPLHKSAECTKIIFLSRSCCAWLNWHHIDAHSEVRERPSMPKSWTRPLSPFQLIFLRKIERLVLAEAETSLFHFALCVHFTGFCRCHVFNFSDVISRVFCCHSKQKVCRLLPRTCRLLLCFC